MPIRVGNLFDSMFTLETLFTAYTKTRTGKRCKYSVMEFERNLGANLQQLLTKLQSGEYRPRDYKSFEVLPSIICTFTIDAFTPCPSICSVSAKVGFSGNW